MSYQSMALGTVNSVAHFLMAKKGEQWLSPEQAKKRKETEAAEYKEGEKELQEIETRQKNTRLKGEQRKAEREAAEAEGKPVPQGYSAQEMADIERKHKLLGIQQLAAYGGPEQASSTQRLLEYERSPEYQRYSKQAAQERAQAAAMESLGIRQGELRLNKNIMDIIRGD